MTESSKRYLSPQEAQNLSPEITSQEQKLNPWEANDPRNYSGRPEPKPPASSTKILLAIGWVILILGTAYTIYTYLSLPAEIPVHFGSDGAPDAWGSKGEFLSGPAILTPLTILCLVLARFPKIHNVPFAYETEQQWQRFYTLSANFLTWVGIGMALILPQIALSTKDPETLPSLLWIPLAICILPTFYYLPAIFRLRSKKTDK